VLPLALLEQIDDPVCDALRPARGRRLRELFEQVIWDEG